MERSQTLFEPELNLTPDSISIPFQSTTRGIPISYSNKKNKRRTERGGGEGGGFRVSLHYYCRQSDYFLMQTKDLPNVCFLQKIWENPSPQPYHTHPKYDDFGGKIPFDSFESYCGKWVGR
jgi:hypothetical protein